jgi:hypothetical protein
MPLAFQSKDISSSLGRKEIELKLKCQVYALRSEYKDEQPLCFVLQDVYT